MEIRLHRIAGQRLKGRFGAEGGRPIGLRIHPAEQTENRTPNARRHAVAHLLFHQMHAIAPIAAEALVATVAGEATVTCLRASWQTR
jgi:hypothetical protein